MARRIRASDLETRTARQKLKARGKPYYRGLGENLHLGYRKGKRRGVWVVRRYVGGESPYRMETIAEADDCADADGVAILNFWQAQDKARGKPKCVSKYTVKDAVTDYLDEHLEGKPSWYDTRRRLHAYALPELGGTRVDSLTAETLRRWHKDMAASPPRVRGGVGKLDNSDPEAMRRRKVSANRVLGLLKAALNHAFREKRAPSDAEWRRVKPFRSVDRPRQGNLTLGECKRLINACESDFRDLVRAALETGARYGELSRLKVRDYLPDEGKVYIGQSKSGHSRFVTLTSDGQSFFADLTVGRKPSDPMFGKAWGKSHQLRPMRAACKRAKIEPAVGFHQLRHTWASLSIKAGIPLTMIAHNLGHADTRMVERHYGHLCDDHVTQTIRAKAPKFGNVASNVEAL